MNYYVKTLGCVAAAVVAALASDARAQQDTGADARRFTLSGFGTLGLMTTNTDKAVYRISSLEDNGVKDKVDAEFGSNLGVQGVFNVAPRFSVTGQVVAQRTEDKFEPKLEWLFVKWQPTDALSLRAGRLGAAVFAVSDYRLVNYSNLYARPPVDFYMQVPFTNIEGVDAIYRKELPTGALTAQVFYGQTTVMLGSNLKLKDKHLTGGNLTYDLNSAVSLRASYAQGKLAWIGTDPYAAVYGGLRAASAAPGLSGLAAVAKEYELNNAKSSFVSLGANVDYNNFIFVGEIGKRKTDGNTIEDTTAWTLTAGYRMGKFTPYALASRIRIDSPVSDDRVPNVAAIAALRAGVLNILDDTGTKTFGAGVRWDFRDNMALKFQTERTKATRDTITGEFASLAKTPAGFKDSVSVYSLSLDFVF